MNKLTQTSVKTVAMLTLGVMIAGSAGAEGDKDGNKRGGKCEGREKGPKCAERAGKDMPGHEERKEFHKAQHEKIKAFREARMEKMKAAREAAQKEEDPYKVVAAAKANHAEAQAEAESFFNGIGEENQQFMESMFAKYDMPEDKQAEIREHAESRRDKMKDMHEKHGDKIMETLDKLAAKDDLTKKDIHKALKSLHKNRPDHGKRGGKRGGKRDGDGEKRGKRHRDGDKD